MIEIPKQKLPAQVIKLECNSDENTDPLDDNNFPGHMYVNTQTGNIEAVTMDHSKTKPK